MAGMLFAGDSTFVSFGIGSMIVVAVAMIGSITAVPAVLALLGSKVDRGRLPFIGRRLAPREEGGRFWRAVVDGSLRRPLLSVVLAGRPARDDGDPRVHDAHGRSAGPTTCRRTCP